MGSRNHSSDLLRLTLSVQIDDDGQYVSETYSAPMETVARAHSWTLAERAVEKTVTSIDSDEDSNMTLITRVDISSPRDGYDETDSNRDHLSESMDVREVVSKTGKNLLSDLIDGWRDETGPDSLP